MQALLAVLNLCQSHVEVRRARCAVYMYSANNFHRYNTITSAERELSSKLPVYLETTSVCR